MISLVQLVTIPTTNQARSLAATRPLANRYS
jgi:hypothetical protein